MKKLVHEYTNTYHRSIDADCSALVEEIEANPNTARFKVGDRVRIAKHKDIFSKGYTIN